MKNRTNVRWLTQLALLVAILLVLNYTPLGYLQIGPLSASLLTVPVAIGAMTMNPMAGAILGGVFGATSFIQAVEGKSAMGAALFQVSPAGTFVVCFVARVLMGLCTALIFNALRKAMPKNEKLACFLGGLSAPVLNTVFFMGFLVLIFYNCDYVQNLANTRRDVALIVSEVPANAACVYTQNLVKGAPILVTQKHVENGIAQAVICNSGNANTCNANGVEIAEGMCALAVTPSVTSE